MFIEDADKLLARLADTKEPDAFLYTIRTGSVWEVQNIHYQPTPEEQEEVAQYISRTVGIEIPLQVSNAILDLYPDAKLALSIDHCIESDTADKLSFAIAHFLTGCNWPHKKENQKPFYVLLKKQMARILERLDEPVIEAPDPFCKVDIIETQQPLPTEKMGFAIEPSVRMGKRSPVMEATKGWVVFRATDVDQPKVEDSDHSKKEVIEITIGGVRLPTEDSPLYIQGQTEEGKCAPLRKALRSKAANSTQGAGFRDSVGVSTPKVDKSE